MQSIQTLKIDNVKVKSFHWLVTHRLSFKFGTHFHCLYIASNRNFNKNMDGQIDGQKLSIYKLELLYRQKLPLVKRRFLQKLRFYFLLFTTTLWRPTIWWEADGSDGDRVWMHLENHLYLIDVKHPYSTVTVACYNIGELALPLVWQGGYIRPTTDTGYSCGW